MNSNEWNGCNFVCENFHYDLIDDLPWNINISLMHFHPNQFMEIYDKVISFVWDNSSC
jgi:hypothetical protein